MSAVQMVWCPLILPPVVADSMATCREWRWWSRIWLVGSSLFQVLRFLCRNVGGEMGDCPARTDDLWCTFMRRGECMKWLGTKPLQRIQASGWAIWFWCICTDHLMNLGSHRLGQLHHWRRDVRRGDLSQHLSCRWCQWWGSNWWWWVLQLDTWLSDAYNALIWF